jgi:hypothetical protein
MLLEQVTQAQWSCRESEEALHQKQKTEKEEFKHQTKTKFPLQSELIHLRKKICFSNLKFHIKIIQQTQEQRVDRKLKEILITILTPKYIIPQTIKRLELHQVKDDQLL